MPLRACWASSKGGAVRIELSSYFRLILNWLWPRHAVAQGASFPAPSSVLRKQRFPRPFQTIARFLIANLAADEERWLPWCVVALGAGIVAYFALDHEPSILFALGIGSGAFLCAALAPRTTGTAARFFFVLVASGGLGFTAAKLRTALVDAPVITRDIGPVRIVGRVENVEIRAADRARVIFAVAKLGAGGAPFPRRVRFTLTGTKSVTAAQPGAVVSAIAVLRPPPEPAVPHGYDFARWAYFAQIGGVGFTYGAPRPLANQPPATTVERLTSGIEQARIAITRRVETAIPGPNGSIAAALITGERGEIDQDDTQAYRDSGLAYVLVISGIHLALAGLGVFWAIRALLALWPRVALTQPIKKWAAVAAFLTTTCYVMISGAGAPAVRSYITLSMMLLGVLADRPVLSMRSVALAALLMLLLKPEDILEPGFQMSFSAVIGLIALAEWMGSRPRSDAVAGRFILIWRKIRRYVVGLLLVSLVANLATAPFAIYHFDRASVYSLLANLLAEPMVAFVVMPSATLAMILMPLGWDAIPLHIMGWGVHAITGVAHWVSQMPGAARLVGAWPASALVIMVLGGLWIALWRRTWRWLGLAPIAMAVVAIFTTTPPDLLIARDFQSAAVRAADGSLVILGMHPDAYTANQWLLRDGDSRDLPAARAAAQCDEIGCVAAGKDGRVVALSARVSALIDDCARAKIVISAVPVRVPCRGPELVFDRSDAGRDGATAITFRAGGNKIETVAAERGKRPWSLRTAN